MNEKFNVRLGSHNSWSFARSKNVFNALAKCQSLNIQSQAHSGVEVFDLHVRFDKRDLLIVCNGLVDYIYDEVSLCNDLNHLEHVASATKKPIYVRVILEREGNEKLFASFCSYLEARFDGLTFFGGYSKKYRRARQYYDFGNDEPALNEKHASVAGFRLRGFIPYTYAKIYNFRNILNSEGDGKVLFLDFVGNCFTK